MHIAYVMRGKTNKTLLEIVFQNWQEQEQPDGPMSACTHTSKACKSSATLRDGLTCVVAEPDGRDTKAAETLLAVFKQRI